MSRKPGFVRTIRLIKKSQIRQRSEEYFTLNRKALDELVNTIANQKEEIVRLNKIIKELNNERS